MESARSFTTADGVALHYRLWREGSERPLLLLVHGLGSNLTRWSEFVEHTSLKRSFDILRVDLRGHGGSFTRRPIGMEIWCADLAAILDAEGYAQAIGVGHSLGANAVLWLAAQHPGRVRGVALIDPVLSQALRGSALWIHRLSPPLRGVVALIRLLNRLGLRRRTIAAHDLRRLDEEARERYLEAGKEEDFVKSYSSPLTGIGHFPTAHYLQELIEMTRPIPRLGELCLPMLGLISRAAMLTDPDTTRAVLSRCPQAEVVSLTAYHWPLTEQPVETRRAIEDWCERLA
ncbi:MAG TPA: alpha/beta hydrolase [Planctomycetota bacterium]|nr:alpha/beta hydrolase [Planctomycetota bacterium]